MKTLLLICTLILFSCVSKNKKGAPLDETDSHYVAPATDSSKTDAALHDDTSVNYLARVRGNRPPVIRLKQILSGTTLTITGTASYDLDGTIKKWLWVQEKGTLVSIVNNTNAIATVYNIPSGEYRFRLTITDNGLATATDTIHVSIKGVVTPPPVDTTVVVPPVTGARNNLIAETTFDGADFVNAWHNTQHCCSYSITQSSEQSRWPGGKSMRVELFKTDATVAASKRAEINENNEEPLNAERWIGVSYYFPSATFAPDKDEELILQFHTSSSTGSPPFELDVVNGMLSFTQANNPSGGATADAKYFRITKLMNMLYDQWVDMVWHYKQSSGSDGLIEGWINGVKVYSWAGANTFTGFTNYMKIGINKWTWMPGASYGGNQTHRLFYIDQLRFGNEKATYNDVNPSTP